MKIEFRAAGSGAYAVLADESVATLGARISVYQPKFTSQPQVEPGFGSAGTAVFSNGNAQWTVSFTVERLHASADASLEFLATHPADISTLGNLDIKITVGAKVTYMLNCALTDFTPAPHSDLSTICRYTFTGGSYTN